MALGENKRNDFHPTVYGYQFSNPEAQVDKTTLTFNWWNKMLKLSIAPKLNNGGDYSQYDHKNAISIYLSVQSAKALQLVTMDFVAWLKENAGKGKEYNRAIQVKNGIVLLSNGGFISKQDTPCVVIAKINEAGKIEIIDLIEKMRGKCYLFFITNDKPNFMLHIHFALRRAFNIQKTLPHHTTLQPTTAQHTSSALKHEALQKQANFSRVS